MVHSAVQCIAFRCLFIILFLSRTARFVGLSETAGLDPSFHRVFFFLFSTEQFKWESKMTGSDS
jgi:hypothetical protein